MSVRKFPFDEQRCVLIYESWKYNSSQLNITSTVSLFQTDVNRHFESSEQWDLVGTYRREIEVTITIILLINATNVRK